MLAEQTPTRFIAFDLLADGDDVLLELPQHERRARLEKLVDDAGRSDADACAIPTSAQEWLQGAEGVVAKQIGAPYRPGERVGMVKIKRVRTIDAVVQGWRPGKEEGTVGSLILGLYDDAGELHDGRPHVRLLGEGEARAAGQAQAVRDRRARDGRPEPLGQRPRARVGRAAARAGCRGHVRPHEQRPHPARHEDHALARGQVPGASA